MKAFHGDQKIKEFYINRIKQHQKLDEIIKGVYWENGKGCAVGCTIHSENHSDYEKELAIPRLLSRLEDRIFENLPNNLAKTWPLRFLESIKVGADLSKVWPKFAIFLLTDPTQCNSTHEQCTIVANAYKDELNGKKVDWSDIRKKASYASYAAANTSSYTASYASSYASYATSYDDSYYASYYAPNAAATAASYAVGDVSNKEIAYIRQSEKLLELLKECE